jgi:hypothetical protein
MPKNFRLQSRFVSRETSIGKLGEKISRATYQLHQSMVDSEGWIAIRFNGLSGIREPSRQDARIDIFSADSAVPLRCYCLAMSQAQLTVATQPFYPVLVSRETGTGLNQRM